MHRWTVQDRYGNEIYLTEERWGHIVDQHDELQDRLDDLLDTLRHGRRKQEALEPQKYRYRREYDDLLYGYNHIMVTITL